MSSDIDLTEVLARPYRVLGIDPGLSGAAAELQGGRLVIFRDFKTLEHISDAVVKLVGEGLPPAAVLVEQVHAMPGQGVVSMFSFGNAYGVAQGAVWALGQPITLVTPQKWQNWFRAILGIHRIEAFDSRSIATDLFPQQNEYFRRKSDHNSADAALLALYGLANTAERPP